MELVASIGALGFWIFLAIVVGGAMWFEARKKESQQETLRRLVESGQNLDSNVVDKMLRSSGNERKDRDLKVAGIITMGVGVGLAVFAWFIGQFDSQAFTALLGVGAMVGTIGIGLLLAGVYMTRAIRDDQG